MRKLYRRRNAALIVPNRRIVSKSSKVTLVRGSIYVSPHSLDLSKIEQNLSKESTDNLRIRRKGVKFLTKIPSKKV